MRNCAKNARYCYTGRRSRVAQAARCAGRFPIGQGGRVRKRRPGIPFSLASSLRSREGRRGAVCAAPGCRQAGHI